MNANDRLKEIIENECVEAALKGEYGVVSHLARRIAAAIVRAEPMLSFECRQVNIHLQISEYDKIILRKHHEYANDECWHCGQPRRRNGGK
jgi:hypothetical protein